MHQLVVLTLQINARSHSKMYHIICDGQITRAINSDTNVKAIMYGTARDKCFVPVNSSQILKCQTKSKIEETQTLSKGKSPISFS